jgi:N-acetylglutamate synthase
MDICHSDRIRMERAHVRAWPALETQFIEGWLCRHSGGGSQRANSVSTVDYSGSDILASIQQVERWYRERGAPARFQTFDETQPVGLTEILRDRGYVRSEQTITMFRRIDAAIGSADVEIRDGLWDDYPSDDWLTVYLQAITEDRRAVNTRILHSVPPGSAFLGYRRHGAIVATTLCMEHLGCAVIECVATATEHRRQGAAREVVNAAIHWAQRQGADWIGLQVAAQNAGAIALYRATGFAAGAHNAFWVQPG